MKILVTGGAGFLGSQLVVSLAKNRSNEIVVFDNFTHGMSTTKNLPKRKNVLPPVSGNIKNYYDIFRTLDRVRPDVVVHLAALVTRPETVDNFKGCAEANYVGTANLLESCVTIKERPSRIVFASCEAARDPVSHYGISKRAAEDLLDTVCPLAGIELAILRFSEIYGFGKTYTSKCLINFLVDGMLLGKDLAIYNVNKVRDYVHVSDAVRACELAISTKHKSLTADIGTGEGMPIKDLVGKLKSACDYKGQLKFIESDLIKVQDSVANTKWTKTMLDFECEADFDECLKELVSKRKRALK